MLKTKNFKSAKIIVLLIACVSMSLVLLMQATQANAKDLKWGGQGDPDVTWYSAMGKLEIKSSTSLRDYITEDVMNNKVLSEKSISKDDVKSIYIEGINYIRENSIKGFNNLTYVEIEEPGSTAIRMSKDAICYNDKLEKLQLGGVEWKDWNRQYINAPSIHDNKMLTEINMIFENWDHFEENITVDKLNTMMPNNGTATHTAWWDVHTVVHAEYSKDTWEHFAWFNYCESPTYHWKYDGGPLNK